MHNLFLLVILMVVVTTHSDSVIRLFSNPNNDGFDHLVVHRNTGQVFVTSANSLYELSSELQVLNKNVNGPKDNANKVLVIDYATNSLISCGSAKQTCAVHQVHNISNMRETEEKVVAGNLRASTVAFIGPGFHNANSSQVLYFGVTYTSQSDIPAVSTRSLDSDTFLDTATAHTKIYINSLSKENYLVSYVYGFSSEGFTYFLTTQRKNVNSQEFISKLVRICQNDEYYYSYMEVPIHCTSTENDKQHYNLAQAAYVGKAGSRLTKSLNISSEEDVLFAVFSKSELPNNDSALCIYPLGDVRKKFAENIERCYRGIGERGLDFITPSTPCLATNYKTIEENFCGLDVNTPLEGKEPISAKPILQLQSELTAVTSAVFGDLTTVLLGTSTGRLKKILIESKNSIRKCEDLVVEEGSRIHSDLSFNPDSDFLYVTTQKTVSKIKLDNCDHPTTGTKL